MTTALQDGMFLEKDFGLKQIDDNFISLNLNDKLPASKKPINFSSDRNVVLCSKTSLSEAETFRNQLQQTQTSCDVIAYEDKNTLAKTDLFFKLYLLLDESLWYTFMKDERLCDQLYDVFKGFPPSSVYLVNRLPKSKRWMYSRLKHQLPRRCVGDYREVEVNTDVKDMSVSSKTNRNDDHFDSNKEKGEKETSESEDSGTDDSLSEDLQVTTSISEGGHHVQIGYKCVMNIEKSLSQNLVISQDGDDNIINVKIVSSPSASQVIVVITTDPANPQLEKLLLTEIDKQKQVINIRLRNYEATVVDIKPGSIIIVIEAKSEKRIGFTWLKDVMETIFDDEIQSQIPNVHLKLDVESSFTIPFTELGNFLDQAQIHKNCVNKEMYEAKVTEMEELKKAYTALQGEVKTYEENVSQKERTREELQELQKVIKEREQRSITDQLQSRKQHQKERLQKLTKQLNEEIERSDELMQKNSKSGMSHPGLKALYEGDLEYDEMPRGLKEFSKGAVVRSGMSSQGLKEKGSRMCNRSTSPISTDSDYD